jgi:sugar phosphate isomerase/epimerase
VHRRDFLNAIASSVTVTGLAASVWPKPASTPIGLQLYTVRRLMQADAERTLASLAEIGYREVELAGLYGRSAREFRAMLDKAGLKAVGGHINLKAFKTDLEKTLDEAETLGHEWALVAWIDQADRTIPRLETIADYFNTIGRAAQKRGMRFAYHNHNFEFKPIDGVVPLDLLLDRTDKQLVDFEMDLFWVRSGGKDPLDYFARYPGRFPLVHVKDMTADGKMVNVGEGVIDFRALFKHADRAGIKHYFVEHDEPTDALKDARISYHALSKIL